MSFILYFVLLLIIPLWASWRVRKAYTTYSQIRSSSGLTGAEVARKILNDNGIYNVKIELTEGFLSDHYDPRNKVVRLSYDNYYGSSLAATAIAAHEVGHAIQDAEDYAFLRFRHSLVPLASLGSNFSYIILIAGVVFQSLNLIGLGIAFMAFAVLFQFVTLPVEFNASSRAMNQVVSLGIINNYEENETKKVLNAAALTYVAAAAVALIELLRFVLIYLGMSRSE